MRRITRLETQGLRQEAEDLRVQNAMLTEDAARRTKYLTGQVRLSLNEIVHDAGPFDLKVASAVLYRPEQFNRLKPQRGQILRARFKDGVMLRAQTEGPLETRQHTLVIRQYSRCSSTLMYYHRWPSNVDSQAMESAPRTHVDVASLADDMTSTLSIIQLAGAAAVAARQGWPDTLDLSQFVKEELSIPGRIASEPGATTPQLKPAETVVLPEGSQDML